MKNMIGFDPEQYVAAQRQDWNRVAMAWEKWDAFLDARLSSCNHRLIEKANVLQGNHVLDLGSGTGYPAIQCAHCVGEKGRVTGLDIADEMLQVARRKAMSLGLQHVTFQNYDVTTLPFLDTSFDAATSRFCLMFLPDLKKTLYEVFRVLKPGGFFAAAVWSEIEKNPYLALPMEVIKDYVELPQINPSIPGLFSLSKKGNLANQMYAAGFANVSEEEFPVEGIFSSGYEYVNCMKEMAAPLQDLFRKLPPDKRDEAYNKIVKMAETFRKGDRISLPGMALIVSGKK